MRTQHAFLVSLSSRQSVLLPVGITVSHAAPNSRCRPPWLLGPSPIIRKQHLRTQLRRPQRDSGNMLTREMRELQAPFWRHRKHDLARRGEVRGNHQADVRIEDCMPRNRDGPSARYLRPSVRRGIALTGMECTLLRDGVWAQTGIFRFTSVHVHLGLAAAAANNQDLPVGQQGCRVCAPGHGHRASGAEASGGRIVELRA